MNELATLVIGMIFGGGILLMALAAAFLFWTAVQMRKESGDSKKETTAAIKANTVAIEKMRSEVALALSQMDAQRLYEASVGIQKVNKKLSESVTQLNKVVFAATPPGLDMSGINTPGFNLDEEAQDDARMIAERNRWLAQQPPDEIDPEQVSNFFAQRRRSGIYPIGSTPPAGGAYQAVAESQPEAPVATLPDLGGDDLSGEGELFK